MTVIYAFANQGRWMAQCPKCGNYHALDGDTLICAACWPGLRAEKFVTDSYGALVKAPHVELIFETREQAIAADEQYVIEYPAEQTLIEALLRPRRIENMNWMIGEPIQNLIDENIAAGLETPS